MRAEIISVGTELLLGQIVGTNEVFLARHLAALGMDVFFMQTVGDNLERVRDAIRLALTRAEIILITGGLGPTEDDLTVAAVADAVREDLVRHDDVAEQIRLFFERRGRTPTENVYKQSYLPRSAKVIPNKRGTAPGVHLERDGHMLFLMPGVPYEMEGMMEGYVIPYLQQRAPQGTVIQSRVLRVTGEGESAVEQRIVDLLHGTMPTIAPYAKLGEVHLRLTAKGSASTVSRALDAGEAQVRQRLGDLVYGVDEQTLEDVVGSLLTTGKRTVAVAESCTGGLIARRLTTVPGSSAYFRGGVVAYSNESKIDLADVEPPLIETHGAVSAPVAEAMASGIRRHMHSDLGLAVTGIAGPTGGTPDKPIGLVFIALADDRSTRSVKLMLGAEAGRVGIQHLAAQAALNLLRRYLLHQ